MERSQSIQEHVSLQYISYSSSGIEGYVVDSLTVLPSYPGCKVPEGAELNDEHNLTIDKVKIKEGYYRHTRFTAQTFVCRHPKACAGTADPNSDDVEDIRLEGDELCRVGFTGNGTWRREMKV